MALKVRKGGVWERISSKVNGLVTATANGALSAGDPVIINTDGTVSKVEQVTSEVSTETIPPNTDGSASNFSDSVTSPMFEGGRIVYVPTGDYFVIAYVNYPSGGSSTDRRLRVRTATVSSSGAITYGTIYYPGVGFSGDEWIKEFQLVYDPDVDKVLLVFYDLAGSNPSSEPMIYSKYVSSSDGTTLTLDTLTTVLDDNHGTRITLDYNKGVNKFLVGYDRSGVYYFRLGTAAADGNSVSWSSEIGITSYNTQSDGDNDPHSVSLLANMTRGFLMTYERQTTNETGSTTQTRHHAFARAIDVNGTTVTVGDEVQLSGGAHDVQDNGTMMLSFHEEDNEFVLMYEQNVITSVPLYTVVMRIDDTYTGVSVGNKNHLYTASYGYIQNYGSFVYDPYVKDIYAYWTDDTASGAKPLMVNKLTLNDSELQVYSLGTKTSVYSDTEIGNYATLEVVGHSSSRANNGMSRFAAAGKTHHIVLFQWQVGGYMAGGAAKAVKIQTISSYTAPSNLTVTNFLGFSESAYANSDTATINIVGSVNKNQSGLLTGKKYYVQTDGTLSTTAGDPRVEAGIALSSTTLLINGGGVLGNEGYPSFTSEGWSIPF